MKVNFIMKIMSIDLGIVRTGIAISDTDETLASPFCVIKERKEEKLIEHIKNIIIKEKINEIVLGLPKNMDGSQGESAQRVIDFMDELKKHININIVLKDERNTTVLAHRYLNINDVRNKKRKAVIDSVAATIILQDYLDFRRNKNEGKHT